MSLCNIVYVNEIDGLVNKRLLEKPFGMYAVAVAIVSNKVYLVGTKSNRSTKYAKIIAIAHAHTLLAFEIKCDTADFVYLVTHRTI